MNSFAMRAYALDCSERVTYNSDEIMEVDMLPKKKQGCIISGVGTIPLSVLGFLTRISFCSPQYVDC